MNPLFTGYSNSKFCKRRGCLMSDTHEFVEKLRENKEKAKKNHQHFGKGHPDKKLPNVKHTKR